MKHRWKKDGRVFDTFHSLVRDPNRSQNGWIVDIFAFDGGYCNGPLCLDCGRTGCHHCHPEMYDEECPSR